MAQTWRLRQLDEEDSNGARIQKNSPEHGRRQLKAQVKSIQQTPNTTKTQTHK